MVVMKGESVLLYLVNNGEREKKIKNLLLRLGIRMKFATNELLGNKVGYLFSISGYTEESTEVMESLNEDILVMKGFTRERMNDLLSAMKKEGIRIPLKAVLTEHNVNWTLKDLYEELLTEHRAMMERNESNK